MVVQRQSWASWPSERPLIQLTTHVFNLETKSVNTEVGDSGLNGLFEWYFETKVNTMPVFQILFFKKSNKLQNIIQKAKYQIKY